MKKSWIILLLLILPTLVLAQEPYHLKLLAVEEFNSTYTGSDADLYLELKRGSGRVFLDTFPLTKIDTQISTRFAKEIACKQFKLNCDRYDFIYTIKAKANIIGGPSAGAAIAALTTIAVLDLDYNKDVTITGTINSGGIIGQVGGVKEKLEAASKINLKKVLVAKGTAQISSEKNISEDNLSNETENFNLIDYAKNNLSLEVVEVIDLDQVVFHLTGKDLNHQDFQVEENPEYQEIMGKLQNLLCIRASNLETQIKEDKIKFNQSFEEEINWKKGLADNSTKEEDFYSAASYCFGLNILLKELYYQEKEPTLKDINRSISILEEKITEQEKKLASLDIKTISDLQTLIVVRERLADTREQIKKLKEITSPKDGHYLLAYAEERFFSALSWMQFFAMDGKKLQFDQDKLQQTCFQKISEAEERHQYASIFVGPLNTINIKEKINQANEALNEKNFDLCLIKAIQAKGEANAVLSVIGLNEDYFSEFIESKLKAVERVIAENSADGLFPILGYSYFQYANSLKEQEKYTALIYLEYALEMSDLDIYFPEEQKFLVIDNLYQDEFIFALEGFIVGVIVTILVLWLKPGLFRRKKS